MPKTTPFESVHKNLGASFDEYDGWRLPADYGDRPGEDSALHQGCVAFDLSSFGRFRIKGSGAEQVIAGLLGKSSLPAEDSWNRAQLTAAETQQRYPLRVGLIDSVFWIITQPTHRQAVFEQLTAAAAAQPDADARIADLTEKTGMMGIYGPKTIESLGAILPFDLSGLAPNGMMSYSLLMMSITVIRGSWLNIDGLELICPASAAPLAAGAIAKYHKKQNITLGGMDCLLHAMAQSLPDSTG